MAVDTLELVVTLLTAAADGVWQDVQNSAAAAVCSLIWNLQKYFDSSSGPHHFFILCVCVSLCYVFSL